MGKLVAIFFACCVFQGVLGGATKLFDSEDGPTNDWYNRVVRVSDEIVDKMRNMEKRDQASMCKECNFGNEVEILLHRLHKMETLYEENSGNLYGNIEEGFHGIYNMYKIFCVSTDKLRMRTLGTELAKTVENIAKHMEILLKATPPKSSDDSLRDNIKMMMKSFLNSLQMLHDCMSAKRIVVGAFDEHGDISSLVQRILPLLERIEHDGVTPKSTFNHVVREYFNNIRDIDLHHSRPTASDAKTELCNYLNTLHSQMDHRTSEPLIKATLILLSRLNTMVEVSQPIRRLIYRIYTITDLITSVLEVILVNQENVKRGIADMAIEFSKNLEHIIATMEESHVSHEFVQSMRTIVSTLRGGEHNKHTLNVSLKRATSEIHKLSMLHQESGWRIANEFLHILEAQSVLLVKTGVLIDDVTSWSVHLFATPNRLSMYSQNDDEERVRNFFDSIKHLLAKIENDMHVPHRELVERLKALTRQFEEGKSSINDFLQMVSLELNELLWDIYKLRGAIPDDLKDVLARYIAIINDLYMDYKLIRGLDTVQTPPEVALAIQDVADRLAKMLHVRVPGFKHKELVYRAHSFDQMLEVAIFRLSHLEKVTSVKYIADVYNNLRRIQDDFRTTIEHPNYDLNVKLCMYIQDAIVEIKKLTFERLQEHGAELFSDFLFGLNHMQNQIQFDFEIITEEHGVKTLNMQIRSAAHRSMTLFKRSLWKPQLKSMVVTQIDVLSRVAKVLSKSLGKVHGHGNLDSDYNDMAVHLTHIVEKRMDLPMEELCKILETYMRKIVEDLQSLSYAKGHDTRGFHVLCKHVLVTFSNMMIRMQNVHYYEYYHFMTNNAELLQQIHKISFLISKQLQTFTESSDVKYDLLIHAFRYGHRLEKISERLQIEAGLNPKGILATISTLQEITRNGVPTIEKITSKFGTCVLESASSLASLLKDHSLMGATHVLIKFTVAVEKLHMHLDGMTRNENDHSGRNLHQLSNAVDGHVHYLTKALEQVNFDNKHSVDVLRTEYHHILEFVKTATHKIHELDNVPEKYRHILRKFFHIPHEEIDNEVDNFRITIAVYAQRIAVILKEVAWILPDNNHNSNYETEMAIEPVFHELLAIVQRAQLHVESGILITQWEETCGVMGEVTFNNVFMTHDMVYTSGKNLSYKLGNDLADRYHSQGFLEQAVSGSKITNGVHKKNLESSSNSGKYLTGEEIQGASQNPKPLLRQLKSLVSEVSMELKTLSHKHDFTGWIHQLVQVVDSILIHLDTHINSIHYINFKNIKRELQKLAESIGASHEDQLTPKLSDALNAVATGMEKLVKFENSVINEVKGCFTAFFKYLCNFRMQIKTWNDDRSLSSKLNTECHCRDKMELNQYRCEREWRFAVRF